MWIAAISDLHGSLPPTAPLKRAKAVIIAGDVGPDYNEERWFNTHFAEWARAVEVPIYMTWGNHDFIGERRTPLRLPENVFTLVDRVGTLPTGPSAYFSPWSPTFMDWAFMKDEDELEAHYINNLPTWMNIMVTHSPPFGLCDRMKNGQHVGSEALRNILTTYTNFTTIICGHIHEGYGAVCFNRDGSEVGEDCDGLVINVALMDEAYNMVNPITFIDTEATELSKAIKRVPLWDTDGDTIDWMPEREE